MPLFLHWVRGRAWRITAGDVGILLYCFWIGAALLAVHGPGRVHSAGIQFVEMFGGYLVGRTLVRSAEDYRTFVRYLFYAMAFLFPFALAEFLTGWSPLRAISEAFLTVEERTINSKLRLGFAERVQGPFAHPILFGLFCSLGVANFFFVFREALVKRLARVGMALAMIFMSLSSAPFLVAGLQLVMMGWDRLFAFMRARWIVLVALGLAVVVALETLAEGGALGFVFETFLLVPQTGYFRLVTLEYGVPVGDEPPVLRRRPGGVGTPLLTGAPDDRQLLARHRGALRAADPGLPVVQHRLQRHGDPAAHRPRPRRAAAAAGIPDRADRPPDGPRLRPRSGDRSAPSCSPTSGPGSGSMP